MKKNVRAKAEPEAASGLSPLIGEVLLEDLLERIAFQMQDVVRTAEQQPKLFLAAADFRVKAMQKRAELEVRLKKTEAEVSLDIREAARQSGEKTTEAGIQAQITMDEEVGLLQSELQEAEAYEEYMRLLLESYRMRRDCLKIVHEQSLIERGAAKLPDGAAGLDELRTNLRAKYAGREA